MTTKEVLNRLDKLAEELAVIDDEINDAYIRRVRIVNEIIALKTRYDVLDAIENDHRTIRRTD